MRGWPVTLALALALALAPALVACDGSGSGGPTPQADAFVAPELTPWSPSGSGTTKAPAYGDGCRLGVDDVFASAPNPAADDTLTLAADSSSATVTLQVSDGAAVVLDATVTLERALVDKVWRRATGSASLGSPAEAGTVVDGTLCFPERLQAGAASAGEFSLVVQRPDGSYRSVSGGFEVPAAAVATDPATAVEATGIVVDLR